MDPSMMPDLSHLSAEERAIIEEVFKRQQAEEQKEEAIAQQADKELEDIERQIAERAETARRLVGTQDDAICQICQKTKFADGIGHKCFYCQLRSCARCGGKTTAKNKNIWACSLCQKRQQILARTGKWMQGAAGAAGGPDGAGRSSPTPSQTSKAGSAASTSSATAAQARTAQPSAPTQPMPASAMTRSEPGAPPASSAVPLGVSSQKQAASLHQDQRRQNTLTRQPSLETESQFAKMNGGPPSATAAAPHHIPTSSAAPPPHTAATTTLTNGPSMPPQNGYGSSRSAAASSSQAAPGGLHDRRSSRRDRDHVAADQPHVNGTRGGGPTSSVPPSTSAAQPPYVDDRHGRRPSANASGVPHHHRESRLSRGQTDDRDYGPDYQPEDGAARSRSPGYRDRDDRKRYDDRYDSRQATSRNDRDSRQRRSERDRTRGERKPSHTNEAHLPRAVPPAEPSPLAPTARRTSPVPPRNRRTKLSRQLKSLSSSEEEEVPSTSADRTSLAEQDFSEKDLLRYIYGTQKVSKNGKRTADSLTTAGATASGPEAPPTSPRVVPGNMLATKIRNYLSHPVSWQPSADQRRLIGHMVLNRNVTDAGGGDLGLKVIGGRHSATGRLGAFVTKVKRGSVADNVGQLRPGDEVLEWNGKCLQNITHDEVYNIINASKNDSKVELIVSRPMNVPGGDDFLNIQRILPNAAHIAAGQGVAMDGAYPLRAGYGSVRDVSAGPAFGAHIPHSQSLVAAPLRQFASPVATLQRDAARRAASPVVYHGSPAPLSAYSMDPLPVGLPHGGMQMSKGQIFGRIEISLLYMPPERELIVTVHRAYDLPPRPDGSLRNPYAKVFLLPDRSEKSRRQSAVLAETLAPIWNESFYYYGLTEPMLMSRVLEVTLWDYDQYEANSFLGETLIDLSTSVLDNQPFSYTLVDMDEENPIRMRLRQRRYSSHTPPTRSRSQLSYPVGLPHHREAVDYADERYDSPTALQYGYGYGHESRVRRSRTYHRGGAGANSYAAEMLGAGDGSPAADWNVNSTGGNGYLSDHGQYVNSRGHQRRPRSATALRNIADYEKQQRDRRSYGGMPTRHQVDYPDEDAQAMGYDSGVDYPSGKPSAPYDTRGQNGGNGTGPYPGYGNGREEPRMLNGRTRQELMQEQYGGYGSDGSETVSVNSAQSMQNRAVRRAQMISSEEDSMPAGLRQQPLNSADDYLEESAQDSGGGGGPPMMMSNKAAKAAAMQELKERKKSLMTRFIPGRNAAGADGKRTGFARSEEVGIPEALAIPGDPSAVTFMKQSSKESTDSAYSDNFKPVLPDGPLGCFVENLGPGQVVGRQVLASPVLGEIELGLGFRPNVGIFVDVKRARNLVPRQGKIAPSIYVKVYLMEGKDCVAKAKTAPAREKSVNPTFQQQLIFDASPKKRMLQITILGDYGRMERKAFMGVVQIRLDDLQLERQPVQGWYKLYHQSSLLGAGPIRKDSENSLIAQQQHNDR